MSTAYTDVNITEMVRLEVKAAIALVGRLRLTTNLESREENVLYIIITTLNTK